MIVLALLMAQSAVTPGKAQTGEQIFAQSCSVGYCHGVAGAAGRGPRLRGRAFEESYLLSVIRDGIPRSAMPAWRGRLSESDILAVTRYVESLVGSSPNERPEPARPVAPEAQPAATNLVPQVQRGRALFFDATRDRPCGSCHELGERGTAVGPDLRKIGKMAPRDIVQSLRSEQPKRLVTIHTADGEVLTALIVSEDDSFVKVYDLSAALPVLHTLARSQIRSREPLAAWSHNAYLQGINAAGMADLIAYLEWQATHETREVSEDDVK